MEEIKNYLNLFRFLVVCVFGIFTLLLLYLPRFKKWVETKELYWVYFDIQEKKKMLNEEVPMNNREKVLLYVGTILFVSGILKFWILSFFPELNIPLFLDQTLDQGVCFLGFGFTRLSAWSLLGRRSKHLNENQNRYMFSGPRWKFVAKLATTQNAGHVVAGAAGVVTVAAAGSLLVDNPIPMILIGQPYRVLTGEIDGQEFGNSLKKPFEYTKDLKESREQIKIARGVAIQENPTLFYSPEGGDKTPKVVEIKKSLSAKYKN